ncbi:MAG: thioesterase family protein [Candidatus Poseidoniia archaeon]|jgi:acyl-CoA thioester hydrolase|nr:thioesterase family protein [Candidatus Poseidoniia archaeon]MDP6658240.1 thioesterase family protein [Candidatus Poseidoniia archaeon]MDP6846102.1 thioesterase family protein [Candidatus Poseidoniia archaeon]MDP7007402.1 thioesterase family protein [Candidatus Poseidoniia archaeon]|tara:strand:+ start:1201 stop:1623 length:423 start_codon:yes stop_codon:yes gene_type:complete
MAFGSWPVSVEFPVHWGDMDSFGHVNNAVYLTWFESARIAYFREIRQEIATPDGVGPILAHMEIDYHLPVEYPDTVRCEATVTSLGNSSYRMAYRLHSDALGAVAAEGDSVVVMIDYATDRSVPLSDELRSAIQDLESKS